jgi:hypothetical protein
MTSRTLFRYFRCGALLLLLMASGALCPATLAQVPLDQAPQDQVPVDRSLVAAGALPEAPAPVVEAVSPAVKMPSAQSREHRFWDKQNGLLFVAAAALNGADFAVTRANLQSGGQELNPLVRVFGTSTAGLAVNFAGETAGVISLSYFFHKTGHHKLERAISLINIGSSASAVGYGLAHR